jgi:hypothetical protein
VALHGPRPVSFVALLIGATRSLGGGNGYVLSTEIPLNFFGRFSKKDLQMGERIAPSSFPSIGRRKKVCDGRAREAKGSVLSAEFLRQLKRFWEKD